MTSKFESHMVKANAKILDIFKDASQIIFTPKGGEAFSADAILGDIEGETKDENGEIIVKNRRITIPLPENTVEFLDGIITVAGEKWEVNEVPVISSGMVDMQCRWIKPVSRHNEMHLNKIR